MGHQMGGAHTEVTSQTSGVSAAKPSTVVLEKCLLTYSRCSRYRGGPGYMTLEHMPHKCTSTQPPAVPVA